MQHIFMEALASSWGSNEFLNKNKNKNPKANAWSYFAVHNYEWQMSGWLIQVQVLSYFHETAIWNNIYHGYDLKSKLYK